MTTAEIWFDLTDNSAFARQVADDRDKRGWPLPRGLTPTGIQTWLPIPRMGQGTIVAPVTFTCTLIVQLPGLTVTGKILNWDGLPLTQAAVTTCGPHGTGPFIWMLLTITDVVELATRLIGVVSVSPAQMFSDPPARLAPVIVAVPSTLTVPLKIVVQASVGTPGADMLIEPVAVKVLPENDDASAGLAVMHAATAATVPLNPFLFMIILSFRL